ncbi:MULTISPECIES: M15 family metallopeptidase [Aestuariibaculum]|uniref:D-alanyl-D-alanine dipeptidase n=1 Tax=Aestuariibaculum lutulentum TaxID=2920935 RepID=A0ABS9REB5_9FLAO|nr:MULTISPECIES: M15 family metallopeptidase [Aestuariibaculum]MCH4551293.1 M15 family metallopeptidase [Aestuariibaculum lutulentum]MCR8666413.1 M15 family metallopeptidase [Aestuariibaculum sp. M13]
MSNLVKYLFIFFISYSFAQLPTGFVYANEVIPDLDVDLRYYSSNNFVGKPVTGYLSNELILTRQAAEALKLVQEELQSQNLCLLVFDGYRPQQAVNHFMSWAKDLNDTVNKQRFYPDVAKQDLFKEEYIATRSGHSKGSTVDLTIIDGNTGKPLDMGSDFDFFGEASWVNYAHITEAQKANRMLLQTVMLKHGFRNYPKEWWHFTLRNEPFPTTYFDFPVE